MPFHLLSLSAHALASVFVFLLLRLLLDRLRPAPEGQTNILAAFVGAVLFALHPLQTEAAAWMNGGNITLAYAFGIASLYLYIRSGEDRGRRTFAGATLLFVCALLTKPSAVSLVAVAFVLEVMVLRRPARAALPGLAIWAALAFAVIAVNWSFSRGSQNVVPPPIYLRPLVAGDAMGFYLTKLVVPVSLAPDYGQTPATVLGSAWGRINTAPPSLLWMLPVVLLVGAWGVWKRTGNTVPLLAICLFAAGLLPTLGLVPFYFQKYSTVADRYAYVALLAPALLLAYGVGWMEDRVGRRGAVLASLVPILPILYLSWQQTGVWRNNETFFAYATTVNQRSAVMQYNRGNSLMAMGASVEAVGAFRRAITIAPGYTEAWTNLGLALQTTGEEGGAVAAWNEALQRDPDQSQANAALGLYYAQRGDTANAIRLWERSLRRDPGNAEIHFNIATAHAQRHEIPQARAAITEALRLRPDLVPAQRLKDSLQ